MSKLALTLIPLVLVNTVAATVIRYKQLDRENDLSFIHRRTSKMFATESQHIVNTSQASRDILNAVKPDMSEEDFETLAQGIKDIQDGKFDI